MTTAASGPRPESPSSASADLLETLSPLRIFLNRPDEVRMYLVRHADLAGILPGFCARARDEFGKGAELHLEVYHDPEIEDQFLKLTVRLPSYDGTVLGRLERVWQPDETMLAGSSGYLLVTTDFRPAGSGYGV
jgi:hypothetical protein